MASLLSNQIDEFELISVPRTYSGEFLKSSILCDGIGGLAPHGVANNEDFNSNQMNTGRNVFRNYSFHGHYTSSPYIFQKGELSGRVLPKFESQSDVIRISM